MDWYGVTVNFEDCPEIEDAALAAVVRANEAAGHEIGHANHSEISLGVQAPDEVGAVERAVRAAHYALDDRAWRSWSVRRRLRWLMHVRVYARGGEFRVKLSDTGEVIGLNLRRYISDVDGETETTILTPEWLDDGADDPLDEDQQRLQDALEEGMTRDPSWFDRDEDPEETGERFRQAWWNEHLAAEAGD